MANISLKILVVFLWLSSVTQIAHAKEDKLDTRAEAFVKHITELYSPVQKYCSNGNVNMEEYRQSKDQAFLSKYGFFRIEERCLLLRYIYPSIWNSGLGGTKYVKVLMEDGYREEAAIFVRLMNETCLGDKTSSCAASTLELLDLPILSETEKRDYYKLIKPLLVNNWQIQRSERMLDLMEALDTPITAFSSECTLDDIDCILSRGDYKDAANASRNRRLLKESLEKIAKKEPVIGSLFKVIAVHFKLNPRVRWDLHREGHFNNILGAYDPGLDQVELSGSADNIRELTSTFAHEFTHQLMNVLFNNRALPYEHDDLKAQTSFDKVKDYFIKTKPSSNAPPDILRNLAFKGGLKRSVELHGDVYVMHYGHMQEAFAYPQYDHDKELIARYPEILADVRLNISHPDAAEYLKSVSKYWVEFIQPQIDRYLANPY